MIGSTGPAEPPAATAKLAGTTDRTEPTYYRIRVAGHLHEGWSAWFGGFAATRESDKTTCLSGLVPDQAALHGLLARVRDLGLVLISVEATNLAGEALADHTQTRPPTPPQ